MMGNTRANALCMASVMLLCSVASGFTVTPGSRLSLGLQIKPLTPSPMALNMKIGPLKSMGRGFKRNKRLAMSEAAASMPNEEKKGFLQRVSFTTPRNSFHFIHCLTEAIVIL
jgi:hypothetical protein